MTSKTAGRQNATESNLLPVKISSYVVAYAWAAIFNALLVLLKENVAGVMSIMASLGHHWVTHSILDLIVFFGLAYYFTGRDTQITGSQGVSYLIWSTLIGGGIIFAFNVTHYFL